MGINVKEKLHLNVYQKFAVVQLKITALIVSRRVAFLFCSYLIPVLKDVFDDSETMNMLNLNKSLVKDIMTYVFVPAHEERLLRILKTQRFAVVVDESSDRSLLSGLCIVVLYFDPDLNRLNDAIWDFVCVYDTERSLANAEQLFEKLIHSFMDKGVPITHLICFAADSCNLMHGVRCSISAKLVKILQHLLVVKCNCHIQHLCAKDAIAHDEFNCEKLAKDISNYFSSSPKRLNSFLNLEKKVNIDQLRILTLSLTRWLSLWLNLIRILSRWTVLKLFFRAEKNDVAEKIADLLYNELAHLNCIFVEFILKKFCIVNQIFQSRKPFVSRSNHHVVKLMSELLKLYMNDDYVDNTELAEIDPENINEMKIKSEIDIGENAENFMKSFDFSAEEKNEFYSNCQGILITAVCNFKNVLSLMMIGFTAKNFFTQQMH